METDFSDFRRDFTCGWKLELLVLCGRDFIVVGWRYAREIFSEKLRRDADLMAFRYMSLSRVERSRAEWRGVGGVLFRVARSGAERPSLSTVLVSRLSSAV